jgi:hypothetical protein
MCVLFVFETLFMTSNIPHYVYVHAPRLKLNSDVNFYMKKLCEGIPDTKEDEIWKAWLFGDHERVIQEEEYEKVFDLHQHKFYELTALRMWYQQNNSTLCLMWMLTLWKIAQGTEESFGKVRIRIHENENLPPAQCRQFVRNRIDFIRFEPLVLKKKTLLYNNLFYPNDI